MTEKSELSYTAEHEWVLVDGAASVATVGITEFAAEQLGDVVYLDLPDVDSVVTAGEVAGEIESTKSVSDLYSPISGTVTEINDEVVETPETVNSDAYDRGWLFKVSFTELPDLMTYEQYQEQIS